MVESVINNLVIKLLIQYSVLEYVVDDYSVIGPTSFVMKLVLSYYSLIDYLVTESVINYWIIRY